MTDHRPILDVIAESGTAPDLPDGLKPAIKFVKPDWTTYGGFSWFQPESGSRWVESPDDEFIEETCMPGGLHVANTVAAAQSGGARPSNCLYVGVDPNEAGEWQDGKRKAPRVYVAGPVDLIKIICHYGQGAILMGADLVSAYLTGANLTDADLRGADLRYAYLRDANLRYANLRGADLRDADLGDAYLRGAYLGAADLGAAYLRHANLRDANLRYANLRDADLRDADLGGADLRGAYGRDDWDVLAGRGSVRD